MSIGNNYRRKNSVGNSIGFLRFSGSVIKFLTFNSLFIYSFLLSKP
jgi:hypothetical protein